MEEVTDTDIKFANMVLREFMDMEPEFMQYIGDDSNWIHVGDDDDDNEVEHTWMKPAGGDCGCGCGGMKSDEMDILVKAGRVISTKNMGRLRQVVDILQQVISEAAKEEKTGYAVIQADIKNLFTIKSHIDPVLNYHKVECKATENGLEIDPQTLSVDAELAINNALKSISAAYGSKSAQHEGLQIVRN
jgi:hypothetical protein